ncbi:hypothetical protein INT46_001512 [Mucor plumbeus]|uniref:Uncharacterized protein n=1 Tax=Mucor plumbeus TaxID=97098 RepID=A0A8H7R9U9_9FUNG|nr:hypothetical protein INT46_001512 [Mucor plumbeus]
MSNKKSSRAKKGDANVPNFVFKLGGDTPASPSFNFSASQPASPAAASPGGFNFSSNPASPATSSFNFGASSPASTSTQPFVFGDANASASSPTANTAFNFNSPNTSSGFGSAPTIKRHASEINSLIAPPDRTSSLRRSASEITFGASSNPATPPTTTTSAFNFSTPSASPSTTTSGFNFPSTNASAGSPAVTPAVSIAPLNTQNSANSFGSSISTISHASSTTPTAPTVSFGSFGSSSNTANLGANTTTPASAFSFSTPKSAVATSTPVASNPAPSFTFGSSPAATTSSAAAPPVISTSSSSSPFSFNKPASSTSSSTEIPATTNATPGPTVLSFGSPSTTSAPTTLLASTSTAPSTGLGGFSFNKPADSPKVSTATTPASSTPVFSFGSTKASDDKSTASATTAPSLTFGSIKPSTPTATPSSTAPTFSFKSTSDATTAASTTSTAAATSTTPKFTFGSDKDKKDESKSTVTSSPFSFGTPAAGTFTTTTAAAGSASTPAITVDPSKPNPFSFEKVLEDLAKIAAQPPNQMYASLITPALAATIHQSQIVNHTSFRIDNIMSTTRFTELPEQAQKELDELEKYIKMESQRCEYIGKQKMPQHLDAMDNARKNTEVLSQQLDALTSTLKVRMANVETLYDAVKGQLRHANDGCAVLEACKHPGNNARWLFGYSEDDDYFSQLARQLSGRVEEYKRCIWEVERTAESWTQNKVQSPQDIADIMRNQNRAFIALSNKVASLHDAVNTEKNYYYQYLKMYS